MIDLKPEYLSLVKHILSQQVPESEVRVFGSRVNGKAHPNSDLDLVLIGKAKMDWRQVEAIKDAFSQSQIPFLVDVLDWHSIPESFRNVISAQYEVIQKPKN